MSTLRLSCWLPDCKSYARQQVLYAAKNLAPGFILSERYCVWHARDCAEGLRSGGYVSIQVLDIPGTPYDYTDMEVSGARS